MHKLFLSVALLLICPLVWAEPKLVHIVRFSDYQSGSEENWLLSKGFQFKEDARYRDRIALGISSQGLVLEAKKSAYGIMINESVNVSVFSSIEIDWGINKFPEGASYENGIHNEALMVMVFLGDKRHPSGSVFIPDSPYFIGLYLCDKNDKLNYPYSGNYHKKNGRYVCAGQPAVKEIVTTRFDLHAAYRTFFDKEKDDKPAISGIALALDTKKARDGGKSSAFIREIRIYN